MDYKKQAQELERDIERLERGYYKWLELWAKEEAPHKVGDHINHGTKRLIIKSITAGKIFGDLYEWVIVSEFGRRVVIPMKENKNESNNCRE